ncbi:MAG: hypothetical protein SOT28_10910, partial [Fusicatenibacter sp.]|nr:hypothetical protein [Fusicatenibacter sp.]
MEKGKEKRRIVSVKAYAKINSFLAVTEKRIDGYHAILSHMQGISLCDHVDVGLYSRQEIVDTYTAPNGPSNSAVPHVMLICDHP